MALNAYRLARRLPAPAKRVARRLAAVADVPLRAAYRARRPLVPVPPFAIRSQVEPSIDPRPYVRSGATVADEIEAVLRQAGIDVDGEERVLDLASGAGRVTVHLAARHPRVRFSACDVDDASIAWLARAAPHVDAQASGFEPPLPYEDGRFGLVLAISLWTHFDRPTEEAWLAELERVVRPGGAALVTVLGPASHGWHVNSPEAFFSSEEFMERVRATREDLRRDGRVFVPYDRGAHTAFSFRGVTGVYGLAFHDHDFVRREWGERFTVEAIVPGAVNRGQDAVVLRRRG